MTGIEIVLFIGARHLAKYLNEKWNGTSSSSSQLPAPLPGPQKVVSIVGPTGAGKSSTGNALAGRNVFTVGVEHGTTSGINEAAYINGYKIKDTPGLLDTTNYKDQVINSLKETELVVYTSNGQLYRQETDLISEIIGKQKEWNSRSACGTKDRKTIVYINMEDLRQNNMPTYARINIKRAIFRQLERIIPAERIAFGASSPVIRGKAQKPEITELENLINATLFN